VLECLSVCKHIKTCTNTHTHTHTHTRTCTHTRMHTTTHARTHTHSFSHSLILSFSHSLILSFSHSLIPSERMLYLVSTHERMFFRCISRYGVATISRLLQITGLFCKRARRKRLHSTKETYNFKEPTNRSHPMQRENILSWVLTRHREAPKHIQTHENGHTRTHARSHANTHTYTQRRGVLTRHREAPKHITTDIHAHTRTPSKS